MNIVNMWMVTSPKQSVSGFVPSYEPYGRHSPQIQPVGWTSATFGVINRVKSTLFT